MKISKVKSMIQGFLVDKVAIVGGRELLSQTMRTTMIKVGNRVFFEIFRTNIFSIATTSNYFLSSVVGVVRVDYFDFSSKKIEKLVWIRC